MTIFNTQCNSTSLIDFFVYCLYFRYSITMSGAFAQDDIFNYHHCGTLNRLSDVKWQI